MNSSASVSHDAIAQRAYLLWEEAGQPHGQATEFWLQAERELHAKHDKLGGDPNGVRGTAVVPPVVGKRVPERTPHSTPYVHPGVTTDSLHHLRKR
jgi:hypothetical protein